MSSGSRETTSWSSPVPNHASASRWGPGGKVPQEVVKSMHFLTCIKCLLTPGALLSILLVLAHWIFLTYQQAGILRPFPRWESHAWNQNGFPRIVAWSGTCWRGEDTTMSLEAASGALILWARGKAVCLTLGILFLPPPAPRGFQLRHCPMARKQVGW